MEVDSLWPVHTRANVYSTIVQLPLGVGLSPLAAVSRRNGVHTEFFQLKTCDIFGNWHDIIHLRLVHPQQKMTNDKTELSLENRTCSVNHVMAI